MLCHWRKFLTVTVLIFDLSAAPFAIALQAKGEAHDHAAPAKLGEVGFPTSCKPAVQADFNRAVALLHSFTYQPAHDAFQQIAQKDPGCAMAHWGVAMTEFHQLWQPPLPPASSPARAAAQHEIAEAQRIGAPTERERGFIKAAAVIFQDDATAPYAARLTTYEREMSAVATANPNDVEAQAFYALALLANASPADKTHAQQKKAADILEPLYRDHPQHPGMAHYLIHAYDNAELAQRGVPMARAYAQIAPAAPHALHMPSHIFTRLGMWQDSIESNIASREAARRTGDTGEQLHAMDYLVYAYLQAGRDYDAAQVIQQLKSMPNLNAADFKVGYSATAMPIRYMVERQDWAAASGVVPPSGAQPHVTAIAVWAKGLGLARSGKASEARKQADELQKLEDKLQSSGNAYWATQVRVMKREVLAWSAEAENQREQAVALMRQAADEEDSVEKLPVTPGPIIPAREQLGTLLLQHTDWAAAAQEFKAANANAPNRRGTILGAVEAAKRMKAGSDGE
jgi:tetratricopeptide (TPR) repeat protein